MNLIYPAYLLHTSLRGVLFPTPGDVHKKNLSCNVNIFDISDAFFLAEVKAVLASKD